VAGEDRAATRWMIIGGGLLVIGALALSASARQRRERGARRDAPP
jgi:hypothetical protein